MPRQIVLYVEPLFLYLKAQVCSNRNYMYGLFADDLIELCIDFHIHIHKARWNGLTVKRLFQSPSAAQTSGPSNQ